MSGSEAPTGRLRSGLVSAEWMRSLVASRWFALADLGFALLAGAMILSWRQAGGWPLCIALVPALVRLSAGRVPFQRTALDLPLLIFLITAALGAWITYSQEAGWEKFWVLLGAVFLYYALAGQPQNNLWPVAGLLSLLSCGIAIVLLLVQDFSTQPADLRILQVLAEKWMSIRPALPSLDLPPNRIGGWLAVLAPFSFALAVRSWRKQWYGAFTAALVAAGLTLIGLLMTSSRGAWAALFGGLLSWGAWKGSSLIAARTGQPQPRMFSLVLLAASLPVVFILATRPTLLVGLANQLPGAQDGASRFGLARDTLYLIRDFPFTGGGLESFPGLYSEYIKVIPVVFFEYSHNLFLDIGLEQGIFGLIAFIGILAGSYYFLISKTEKDSPGLPSDLLRGAVLAGLTTLLLHGTIDDALYANGGTPLIAILPALAVAVTRHSSGIGLRSHKRSGFSDTIRGSNPRRIIKQNGELHSQSRQNQIVGSAAAMLLFGISLLAAGKPVLAAWDANLGAVKMARDELADFPTGKWDTGRTQSAVLSPAVHSAKSLFEQSLRSDPENATARYRLGLIAFYQTDFESAIEQLEIAHRILPGHIGIIKTLGYAYTWTGSYDLALPLLMSVPEAQHEMNNYSWWWKDEQQPVFADHSKQMAKLLKSASNTSK